MQYCSNTETSPSYKSFLEGLRKTGYHARGHLLIAEHCSPEGDEGKSHMGFDVVSARDPIFYRWHGHLEQARRIRRREKPILALKGYATFNSGQYNYCQAQGRI